jgi:hypothetical protein
MLAQTRTLLVPSLDLSEDHEHGVELALSDLHGFFSELAVRVSKTQTSENEKSSTTQSIGNGTIRRRQKMIAAVGKKLAFYLAAVQAVRQQYGRKVWLELSAEVGKEIERLRAELEEKEEDVTEDRSGSGLGTADGLAISESRLPIPVDSSSGPTRARIEEL